MAQVRTGCSIGFIGSLVALGACTHGADLSLLDDPEAIDWSEHRRRMNVRVISSQTGQPREETPAAFVALLETECDTTLTNEPADPSQVVPLSGCSTGNPPPFGTATVDDGTAMPVGNCFLYSCIVLEGLCVAHRLEEIAATPAETTVGTDRVPPQSQATRAALHEQAIIVAREAMLRATEALNAAIGLGTKSTCAMGSGSGNLDALLYVAGSGDPPPPEPTLGQTLATSLVEAYHLVSEAAEGAAEKNVAVADSAYSLQPSLTRSADYALFAPVLSRGHAAELLAGTDLDPLAISLPLFVDAQGDPPCTMPEATPAERAAIGAIREAALPPSRLSDPAVTIDDLVAGSTSGLPTKLQGSVRERLDDLYDMTLPTSATDVYAYLGTDRESFEAARQRIVQESLAFSRSSQEMPARELVTDGSPRLTKHTRYAAVARPPARLPAAHWTARARDSTAQIDDDLSISSSSGFPRPDYARRDVSRTLDYGLSAVIHLLRGPRTPQFSATTMDPLALLGAQALRERPARLEVSVDFQLSTGTIRLLGLQNEDVRLVRGTAGLTCAVEGHIDGEPCDLSTYLVGGTPTTGTPPTRSGFSNYRQWTINSELVNVPVTIHAVRLIPGGGAALAGQYEALTGATIRQLTGSYRYFRRAIPVEPWLEDLVKATIEPSPDQCVRPADNCADAPDRIPLENELSEDSDGLETSWRTYLDLARQAADEADALGEQLLEAGLEMDIRAEAAMEDVERACGAAIDVDWLTPAPGTPRRNGDCNPGTCPTGYTCYEQACLYDPVALVLAGTATDPEHDRLRSCIGPGSTVPLVSLGTRDVCVWRHPTNTNLICADSPTGHECPYFADRYGSCNGIPGSALPSGHTVVAVTTKISLFGSDPDASDPGAESDSASREQICNAIRTLRNADATDRAAAEALLFSQTELNVAELQAIASNIQWEAEPLDFGTLYRNGEPWISTGTFQEGPGTLWPCSPGARPVTCSGTSDSPTGGLGPLFCKQPVSCTNATNRAFFNDRLARALVALRGMTDSTFEGFHFPAIDIERTGYNFDVDRRESFAVPAAALSEPMWTRYEAVRFERSSSDHRFRASGPREARIYRRPSNTNVWTTIQNLSTTATRTDFVFVALQHTADLRTGEGTVDTEDPTDIRSRPIGNFAAIDFWGPLSGRDSPRQDIRDVLRLPGNEARLLYTASDGSFGGVFAPDPAGQFSNYWTHHGHGYDPHLLGDNEAYIAPEGIRARDVLDALELACEFPLTRTSGLVEETCDEEAPSRIRSVEDLPLLRSYLTCIARRIEERGERLVIANVPSVIVDVGPGDTAGTFPRLGGDFGVAAARLRQGLIDLQAIGPMLATELRQFAEDTRQLELAIEASELREELASLRFTSTVAQQTANCAAASTGLINIKSVVAPGAAASAAAVCLNSLVQISIAVREKAIELHLLEGTAETAFSQFMQTFNSRIANMDSLANTVSRVSEDLSVALVEVEAARDDAERALARATFADADSTGRVFRVNTVMRRRFNTLQLRYENSRRYAVRMAYLARLALEQRLGLKLAELDRDLSLVENPSRWQSRICELSGLDYERIRDARDADFESFEDEYIGDYVRRLEAVVESYRIDFPFSDGSDTSVVSLRDEIHNVMAQCEMPGPNLLYESGSFDVAADATAGAAGWEAIGCQLITSPTDATPNVISNCVTPQPLEMTPDAALLRELGQPLGFRIIFGEPDKIGSTVDTSKSSFRWSTPYFTRFAQILTLEPGRRYRLSWYGKAYMSGPNPATAIRVLDASTLNSFSTGEVVPLAAAAGWSRYYRFVDTFGVSAPVDSLVVVEPVPPGMGNPTNQAVDLAGFMLEDVTAEVPGTECAACAPGTSTLTSYVPEDFAPPVYFDTHQQLTQIRYACEDTTGERFRKRAWRRRCEVFCPPGVAECDEDSAFHACYRETEFTISLQAIEEGEIIHSGGFARGNYNYRVDSLALNAVGAGLRDCSDVVTPSTCFSAGWLPFSIEHLGPYYVRDHFGRDSYEAPLFTGVIEHGRALAAERYVTNPLSSADRALVEPYFHRELRGRPLSGTYRLRIWEEPGVRFDRIEDIQIILNYRYWTRLD